MAEYDFEPILKEMLNTVPEKLSKRVGEPIYTTLAPTAMAIAAQDFMIGYLMNLMFADTSEGTWLDRVVYDFGLSRELATKAIRKIKTFDSDMQPFDVPLTTRFSINELTFKLTEKDEPGIYLAECETPGTDGNLYSGTMLPVDNLSDVGGKRFGGAELLSEPVIAARDVETDDALRTRFYIAVRETPFGGNKADYRQKALSIDGVGAAKVFGAPDMGPGKVGVVIADEQGNRASDELVEKVQNLFGTEGDGLSPIWHTAFVKTSADLAVNVNAPIRLKTGASIEVVRPVVQKVIRDYIENIAFHDATVFLVKLVAAILNSHESILDVGAVTLNGSASNISLQKTYANFEVPTVGDIVVTEVV